jgi:tetratricopeptide (TPR) repeat protein
MEVLTRYALIFGVFISFLSLNAQSELDIKEAFRKSYDAEFQLKYLKSIEELNKVSDQSLYEVNLRMGWLHYKAGKYLESISFYKKAIAKMPYSIEARLGIVYPLGTLDKWDNVIEHYKVILKYDSGNPTALYRLGLIHYNRTEYSLSWKFIQQYIHLYPFDFDGNSLAGWIKFSVGKKEEAFVFFKKALLVNPYDASFNKVLGIK